tara:strand:+ start:2883 stop:3470 length:588 start_codon:yes stop_codon:yes gene_type:complete
MVFSKPPEWSKRNGNNSYNDKLTREKKENDTFNSLIYNRNATKNIRNEDREYHPIFQKTRTIDKGPYNFQGYYNRTENNKYIDYPLNHIHNKIPYKDEIKTYNNHSNEIDNIKFKATDWSRKISVKNDLEFFDVEYRYDENIKVNETPKINRPNIPKDNLNLSHDFFIGKSTAGAAPVENTTLMWKKSLNDESYY